MNYFRKISAPTLEERVSSLETEVASLKGGKASETIEFEGATYRKVEREAREGDVVILRANGKSYFELGKPYKLINNTQILDAEGGELTVYRKGMGRTRETVDVYAPIEQAKYIPQVGDIFVVTGNTNNSDNNVGDIGKITYVGTGEARVRVVGQADFANWTLFSEMRKATPAEVEAYEKAAHKASFAVGDYVKVVKSYRNLEGAIAKITQIGEFNGDYGIAEFEIEHLTGKYAGEKLVADADQIVKATDAEIAKTTAPKLKAGDFIKITSGTPSILEGEIYEVLNDVEYELYILDKDGDPRCFPLALGRAKYEIVDAETAKWAKIGRKPNEFKKGDVVRVTTENYEHKVGDIRIISSRIPNHFDHALVGGGCINAENIELVAPVESTVA